MGEWSLIDHRCQNLVVVVVVATMGVGVEEMGRQTNNNPRLSPSILKRDSIKRARLIIMVNPKPSNP